MKLLIAKTIYFVIGTLSTITFGLLLLSQYDYSTVYASASKDPGAKLIGWVFFTVALIFVIFPFYDQWKNDICRIITKWGTDDDQSYLDESLVNEIYN